METQSREWFDRAYKLTGGILPFGVLTRKVNLYTLKHFSGPGWTDEELIKLLKKTEEFCQKIPPLDDFAEEKDRIYPELAKDLTAVFPYAHTGISFGGIVGDIDLGLLTVKEVSERELMGSLREHRAILQKYPMLDGLSLAAFCCRDGHGLLERIVEERVKTIERRLDYSEWNYLARIVKSAKTVWGSNQELDRMKEYLEEVQDFN